MTDILRWGDFGHRHLYSYPPMRQVQVPHRGYHIAVNCPFFVRNLHQEWTIYITMVTISTNLYTLAPASLQGYLPVTDFALLYACIARKADNFACYMCCAFGLHSAIRASLLFMLSPLVCILSFLCFSYLSEWWIIFLDKRWWCTIHMNSRFGNCHTRRKISRVISIHGMAKLSFSQSWAVEFVAGWQKQEPNLETRQQQLSWAP